MRRSFDWCLKTIAVLGLLIGSTGSVKADLVLNGDFGTGDFTGWTLSGDSSGAYVTSSFGGEAAALTTSSTDGFLTQNLATTSGQEYTVSFLLGGDGATPNSLTASLGGTTLFSLSDIGNTLPNGTPYSTDFTASSSSSLLSFDFVDNPGFLYLTDISVIPISSSPIPEPSSVVMGSLCAVMLTGHLWRKRGSLNKV